MILVRLLVKVGVMLAANVNTGSGGIWNWGVKGDDLILESHKGSIVKVIIQDVVPSLLRLGDLETLVTPLGTIRLRSFTPEVPDGEALEVIINGSITYIAARAFRQASE